MATRDATGNAAAGLNVAYQPSSPYESRMNVVDFSQYNVAASGADVVNVFPLNLGENVISAFVRVDVPGAATATIKLDDSRTGGGALIAATAADAAAGTRVKGAGAAIGAVTTTAGFLTLTTVAAVALTAGKVSVFAIVQKPF